MAAKIKGWTYVPSLKGYVISDILLPRNYYSPFEEDPSQIELQRKSLEERGLSFDDVYFYYDGHYFSKAGTNVQFVESGTARFKVPKGKDYAALLANATDIEVDVYDWLLSHNIIFDFQSQLIGGFDRQLGDAIVDFLLIETNTVLRVQSEYWHGDIEVQAKDLIQKERLQNLGYVVVDVWEKDIESNIENTMTKAAKGEEIPHG